MGDRVSNTSDGRAARLRVLHAGAASLVVRLGPGAPALAYIGARLRDETGEGEPHGGLVTALAEANPHAGLSRVEPLAVWPEPASGSTATPGLEASRPGQGDDPRPAPVRQRLQASAAPGETAASRPETCVIEARDAQSGVCQRLTITPCQSAFIVQVRLINEGDVPLTVHRLAALTLPAPEHLTHRLTFDGRWAHEWRMTRAPLGAGTWSQSSHTGRSGHHAMPGLVCLEPECGETTGESLSAHLAWSGDHRLMLERLRDGRMALMLEALAPVGGFTVAPGEGVDAPAVHLAWSSAGLNGLRAVNAGHVRTHVLAKALGPRPVQLNTWEAVYFDHDLTRLKALADAAADVGVERFVLDDGWFGRRTDDTRGLGDWTARPGAYPHGLAPLIEHVRTLGMAFGIWVEPEMVNADSALFEAHPDWIAGPVDQVLGRGQYALDVSRADVRAHLVAVLDRLLSEHAIDAVKWDMNRDLPHIDTHAQTLGYYALIDAVRAKHPSVEFETCASGGARSDYGALARGERIWVSDMHDPDRRQAMHAGFSLFFPPEVMGAHVGPAISHQTGRLFPINARIAPMLLGHLGIEHDLTAITDDERAALTRAIAFYKARRERLAASTICALSHPDPGLTVLARLAPDGSGGVIALVQDAAPQWARPAPLRIPGLAPDARYAVRAFEPDPWLLHSAHTPPPVMAPEGVVLSGQTLGAAGLGLPVFGPGRGLVLAVSRASSRIEEADPAP